MACVKAGRGPSFEAPAWLAAELVLRIDPEQVVQIGLEADPHVEERAVRVFLDEVGVVVLRLGETVGHVLGNGRWRAA